MLTFQNKTNNLTVKKQKTILTKKIAFNDLSLIKHRNISTSVFVLHFVGNFIKIIFFNHYIMH